MRQRIQTLDGLRFLAAIGVLWIHTWTLFGNPRCLIGPVDIVDLLAIGGNGVDLFFVISGFCMYYFYASKTDFSYHDFYRFLFKRWVRLSPAFYVATLIFILLNKFVYHLQINAPLSLLHSIFYLNIWWQQYIIASHFWTLTVEWQFYFIVPFLLIYKNKIGFNKTFTTIFSAILLIAIGCVIILTTHTDVLTNTILFRGVEFGFGILTARLLIKNNTYFKHRLSWLLAFIIITYIGRVLISKHALSLSHQYYNLIKLAGFGLMSSGFAGILYLSVTSAKWLNIILGNRLFKVMGRISYSFYLLHALVFPVIASLVIAYVPQTGALASALLTTILSTAVLYPVSQLSYNLLEKPFLSIGNLNTK